MTSIAAIIATHNRHQLLAERALPSVAHQSRPPDVLVVVDDSDEEHKPSNRRIVANFQIQGTEVVYLENFRTPGAAGAWNSALSWLQDAEPLAFAAFLDDDDAWAPTYLERCEEAVTEGNVDMVAAGIVYHKTSVHEGWPLSIPERLDVGQLFVRNPHVQGSNLFVRLRKLLEAGGFDEALTSTTDRDMCIRLTGLGSVRFEPLNEHLIHHYAEDDRPRLSSAGGDAKQAGLRQFYRKYGSRMTEEQRAAFVERSLEAYRSDPTVANPIPAPTKPVASPDENIEAHLDLVVGAITSPDLDNLDRLLGSLALKMGNRMDVTPKVLLLENGFGDAASHEALREIIARASHQGLNISVKSLEEQRADADAGVFEVCGQV